MDEQTNKSLGDEEFHFTPDETPSTQDVYTTTKRPAFAGINRRNLLILVGVLILLFVIFKLGSMLYNPSKKLAGVQQPPPPQVVATPIPVTTPPPVAPTQAIATPSQQALEGLKSDLTQQMQAMQSQVNQLANTVTTLQTSLTTLQNQVNALNDTLQAQAREAALRLKKQRVRVLVARPVYYIQAMIPTRAWLVAPDGTTLTVTIGDVIPGVGVVKMIYPTKGYVITRSGVIIRYRR
jgi:intracellular multiplication protein IcmG